MTDKISQNLNLRALLLLGVCLFAGQFILLAPSLAAPIAALLVVGAGICFMLLPPGSLVPLYFLYLLFEGAVKIMTNYHPVMHVASDLVLLGVFWRLYQRKKAEPDLARLNESTRADLRIAIVFFCVYWTWVFVQFFNPVSLGLLPSFASLKLHLIPYLCFFMVCFYLKEEEVKIIPPVLLALVTFEGLFSLFDWYQGVGFLTKISPRYYSTYMQFLRGYPYRPFGTTALPGMPAIWVANGVMAMFLVYFSFEKMTPEQKAKSLSYRLRNILWLYIPIALLTLIICQVRISLIRTVLIVCIAFAIQGRRQFAVVMVLVAGLFTWNYLGAPRDKPVQVASARASASTRFDAALGRIRTLQSKETYTTARSGSWAFQELLRRSEKTMTGIGLSRMSASSGPWTALINKDPFFGASWSFADNLALAVFTELGTFGMGAYFLLFVVLFGLLIRRESIPPRLMAVYLAMTVIAGYASEGLFYQPEASIFWTFIGLGFRSESGA